VKFTNVTVFSPPNRHTPSLRRDPCGPRDGATSSARCAARSPGRRGVPSQGATPGATLTGCAGRVGSAATERAGACGGPAGDSRQSRDPVARMRPLTALGEVGVPLDREGPPRSGILQRRSERRCQGWRGAESSGAERHTQCLALTTSRAALSSPIVSAGWHARTSGRPASAEGGAMRSILSLSICPPDGRTPEGGQEGRLGLTALSADSERPRPCKGDAR
jgi:hypothetical protein